MRGCLCTIGTILAAAWGLGTAGALLFGAALPIATKLNPDDDKIPLVFLVLIVVWLILGAYPGFEIAKVFGCQDSA